MKKRKGRGSVNIAPIADCDIGESHYSSRWTCLDDNQTASDDDDPTTRFKPSSHQDSSTLTMDSLNRNIIIDYKESENSYLEEIDDPVAAGMYLNCICFF